jgi:3-deoxy-manno-octulosonate cytidylyltransferase (CMP-KDO synthetase)
MVKQVFIIPFRRDIILENSALKPTPLELAKSIDMMRILENGLNVRMVPTKFNTQAKDTVEDLLKVEKLMTSTVG